MRGLRIAVWTTLLAAGAVLLVVAALVPGGWMLFRRLAEDAARSRVELAAVGALERVEGRIREAETAARILAERPTLSALASSGSSAEILTFLERFRVAGALAGCALVRGDRLEAATPSDLPWSRWIDLVAEGPACSLSPAESGGHDVVAGVPLPGGSDGRALVVTRLDREFARELEQQVGLSTRILLEPHPAVDRVASERELWRAQRFLPPAADGFAAGVEVTLPLQVVMASIRPQQRRFALLTLVASLVALGAGMLAARQLARPLAILRSAAERIGRGDLGTPVPRTAGVEAGALATTMEDMRLRLRAAGSELREREAEAKALLEGIVEGVFAVDGDRRIRYMNAQAAGLLGVDPSQALGRFCGDLLRPLPRDGRSPCDQSCPIVHARSRGNSRATEIITPPSGRRTLVVTSAPPSGTRQVQLIRDETELEAARRSRDAVLANVSHELRTPLSAQLASIELLRDEMEALRPPAGVLELCSSLQRSTLRLTRLIDNLLESVRIETGREETRKVPVDLGTIAREASSMIEPLLQQRDQRLVYEVPDDLPPVMGDPSQLTQVLCNLIANAHKFAPAGTEIRIGGSTRQGECSLWVDDQGPGVPAGHLHSVFDRFHRADPGAAEGMGLGLWIVKSIAERHGGRVEASTAPLGGARFELSLPSGGVE